MRGHSINPEIQFPKVAGIRKDRGLVMSLDLPSGFAFRGCYAMEKQKQKQKEFEAGGRSISNHSPGFGGAGGSRCSGEHSVGENIAYSHSVLHLRYLY